MDNLKTKLIDERDKIDALKTNLRQWTARTHCSIEAKSLPIFITRMNWISGLQRKYKVIGMSHPPGSLIHPNRSANSPWIEVRFNDSGDMKKVF